MGISDLMRKFEESLTIGDDVTARAIARSSGFAAKVETRDDTFVTGLDLAMTWGSAEICDVLLRAGARLDVPVGVRPSTRNGGATSLTRAVSTEFSESVENHRDVIDVIGKHQAVRQKGNSVPSLLSEPGARASVLFDNISASLRQCDVAPLVPSLKAFVVETLDSYQESEYDNLRKRHQIAVEIFETFATIKLCTKALDIIDRNAEPRLRPSRRP